jgi:hypothetical protein
MRDRRLEIIQEDVKFKLCSYNDFTPLAGKRVLITGGTGILGTYILAFLAGLKGTFCEPDSVWFVSRNPPDPGSYLGHITKGMNFVKCNRSEDFHGRMSSSTLAEPVNLVSLWQILSIH